MVENLMLFAEKCDEHYTVYALSNTRAEILKIFGNWIIIFIIDFLWNFCFFNAFCRRVLQFLGFLRIYSYLETTLKECEISGDLKKILERWQHCVEVYDDLKIGMLATFLGCIFSCGMSLLNSSKVLSSVTSRDKYLIKNTIYTEQ